MVEIRERTERCVVERAVKIEGADLVHGAGTQKPLFRPEKVQVTFVDGVLDHIYISGPRVQKNGRTGSSAARVWSEATGFHDLPEWASGLLEAPGAVVAQGGDEFPFSVTGRGSSDG